MKTIGFIGIGVMGSSMVEHLLKEKYEVNIYNRTKFKADKVISLGATWCESIGEVAKKSDIVITMVGFPKDVKEIYLGENGIVKNMKQDGIIIDMTTSSPTLAKEIYEEALKKNVHSLDAPVSGGDVGAKNATLTIMVGGEETIYNQVEDIFKVLGSNVVFHGQAGNGQHTKLANQIAIASGMLGVAESIIYAENVGLNVERVFQSIENGAAGSWSLSNLGPRMLKRDYAPGFYVKHFIKDMKIAIEESEKIGLYMPGLKKAKTVYDALSNEGFEDCGTQAVIELLKKHIKTL